MVSLVVLTLLVAAAWGVGRTPMLAVRTVNVVGTGPTTRQAALAAAGLDRRHQMLDLALGRMSQRLEALPWVAHAAVRRQWPTTVEIDLTARVPVAQAATSGGQVAVVDGAGRVLATGQEAATVLSRPGARLARLAGIGVAGPAGSALPPGFEPALALVRAVTPALATAAAGGGAGAGAGSGSGSTSVDTVTSAPDGSWKAVLASGIAVVFGSPDQLEAKVVAMRTVMERVDLTGVATIDVRVPDTPVLTKGNRASIVSTISRG